MYYSKIAAAVLAASVGLSAPCLAAEEAGSDEASKWTGDIALGILAKRGNTRSNSYTANLGATRDSWDWRHTMKADALNEDQYDNARQEYKRSAEKYFASYKLDRKFGEGHRNYVFNVLTYEKDAFSGFQYKASYALGLGRSFIDTEKHKLSAEAGPGYKVNCLEPDGSYSDCEDKNEQAIARLAASYLWQISEGARFTEELSTEIGEDSTSSRAESILTSKINSSFSLRVRHLVTHESEVPAGKKESDHEVSVGLVYTF